MSEITQLTVLLNDRIDSVFGPSVQAAQEPIVNALIPAKTMKGIESHKVIAILHDPIIQSMKRYGRSVEA